MSSNASETGRYPRRPLPPLVVLVLVAATGCHQSNDLTGLQPALTGTASPTATPTPVAPRFTVSGTVAGGGTLEVWIQDSSVNTRTTTDPQGHYTLTGVPAGTHTVTARSADGALSTAQATVPPDATGINLYFRPSH